MIPLFRVGMAESAAAAVADVLEARPDGSRWIGQGPLVERFEAALAPALGLRAPPLSMNSGTIALTVACRLAGAGPGAEVITSPMTCLATTAAIMTTGATPVWADVDACTGLISPSSVEQLRTPRTVAVVAVDWAGAYPDFAALRAACAGLPLIEDAAHTFGPGPVPRGDHVAWSFQAIKFLTTVDGGALRVPPGMEERARRLRWYGLERGVSVATGSAPEIGYKGHMNDVAAAVGLANLPLALEHLDVQRERASLLRQLLVGATATRVPPATLHDCAWFLTARVARPQACIQYLAHRGIEASVVHRRNDEHPGCAAASGGWRIGHPGIDHFAAHAIGIPCGWWTSERQIEQIATALWDWGDQPAAAW